MLGGPHMEPPPVHEADILPDATQPELVASPAGLNVVDSGVTFRVFLLPAPLGVGLAQMSLNAPA